MYITSNEIGDGFLYNDFRIDATGVDLELIKEALYIAAYHDKTGRFDELLNQVTEAIKEEN